MIYEHCVAWSFGKVLKNGRDLYESSMQPGPGQYSPNANYVKESIKGFKMNGNARNYNKKPMTNANTGVGSYKIPSKIGEGPKYSMKGINGTNNPCKNNCSPGPAYKPLYPKEGVSYSFTGRRDIPAENAKNPGVGQYTIATDKALNVPSTRFGAEPKGSLANMCNPSNFHKWNEDPSAGDYLPNSNYVKPTAPKFSFGTDDRFKPDKASQVSQAGPGSYGFNPLFGNEGRATSMGNPDRYTSRLGRNRLDDVTPGPGAYNSTMYNKPNPKGFKMGSSSRDMPNKQANLKNPSPADYDSSKALSKLLDKSPKWGWNNNFTSGNPDALNKSYSPGPGAYNTREKIGSGGPSYSLGPKNSYPETKWKESVPGPCDYNNADTMKHMKTNPGWKFGTEMKGNNNRAGFKNENPGPDMYNTCRNFIAPSTKFGKSDRMEKRKKTEEATRFYRIPCAIVNVNPYTREAGKFDDNFKFV